MNRETALAAVLVAVLAATAAVVATVPGAVAEESVDDREPPGRLSIADVDVSAGAVSGGTATLRVDSHLTHRGGVSENVTVAFRAVGLDGGLLATSRTVDVASVSEDREVTVSANLSVEREGGYRIETVVYRDDRRVAEGSREVRGVGTLQPAYARTAVGFERFEGHGVGLPAVEYSVADAADNRTTLDVSAYLTNAGDDAADGLEVVLTARQADSGIVADRTTVEVGEIAAGRTVTPSAELSVPSAYNYYLDAVLWADGVVVGTARSAANLNPSESLSVNVSRDDDGLQVGEFETGDAPDGDPSPEEMGAEQTTTGGQAGFGALVALAALAGAALLAGRRQP